MTTDETMKVIVPFSSSSEEPPKDVDPKAEALFEIYMEGVRETYRDYGFEFPERPEP